MTDTRNSPRWKTSSWGGHPHYLCHECRFDTMDRALMLQHARNAHPREWEPGHDDVANEGPLHGVPFSSKQAAELAEKLELTRKHFEGRTQSGRSGYTVADVQAAFNPREG